jgi:hypothetical protein
MSSRRCPPLSETPLKEQSMFTANEWSAILGKLREQTESGRAKWMANGHHGAYLEVGDVTYVVHSRDYDGVAPWVLRVNKSNDPDDESDFITLDEISTDPDVADLEGLVPGLESLKDLAFKSSAGGLDIVNDLLSGLDEL